MSFSRNLDGGGQSPSYQEPRQYLCDQFHIYNACVYLANSFMFHRIYIIDIRRFVGEQPKKMSQRVEKAKWVGSTIKMETTMKCGGVRNFRLYPHSNNQ